MPGPIRLFVAAPLQAGLQVPATAGQAHYLGAVMRRAIGDEIRLFDGAEGEWRARIVALRRDRAAFEPFERIRPQAPEPGPALLFACLKRDAMELATRMATELGASALQPALTERTVAPRPNLARLAAIATEAAEQCERLTVPVPRPPRPLAALLAEWPADQTLAAAIEREPAPCVPFRAEGLLIGPEGGFSSAERAMLRAHPRVRPLSLGGTVLRADTAVAAGLALLRTGA